MAAQSSFAVLRVILLPLKSRSCANAELTVPSAPQSILLIVALYLFFDRTVYGKALRATAVNRIGARLVGISIPLSGRLAGLFARVVLRLRPHDLTGGFKAWRATTLADIPFQGIHAGGYVFQIEMTWRAFLQRLRVGETPIVFYERRIGQSKVDLRIISEAAFGVLKLRWKTRSELALVTGQDRIHICCTASRDLIPGDRRSVR